MKYFSMVALGAVLLAATNAGLAQNARTIYLYNASQGGAPGLAMTTKTGAWGNGSIKPTRQPIDYEGANVLEVQTRSFAEGARFDLNTPLDITPYRVNGFVRLRLRFAGAAEGAELTAAPPPARPLAIGEQNDLSPNASLGGATGDFNFPGLAAPIASQLQQTPITSLRVTFIMDKGTMMGRIPVNLSTDQADENGWRLFTLAIRDMVQTPNASGPVKRVVLSSDNADTFFLAQAALVNETGQITVSLRRPQDPEGKMNSEIEVRPGTITLIADVEAGATDPIIEWNFDADDVGNLPSPNPKGPLPSLANAAVPLVGPRIDARGLSATFTYPNEEQNYRVEVTVRDKSGSKLPVTASVLLRVRG